MRVPLRPVNTEGIDASNAYVLYCCGAYIERWERQTGHNDTYIAKGIGCSRQAIWSLKRGKLTRSSLTWLSYIAIELGTDLITMILEGNDLLKAENE
jgi:hypothetical protein